MGRNTAVLVAIVAALLLLLWLPPAAEKFACSPGYTMRDGTCVPAKKATD